MSRMGKMKGANGEREFCRWLMENFELGIELKRNLDQVRDGGSDVMGLPPFQFEVKRCEALAKRDWWLQVCNALQPDRVAVVAFRQNRRKWHFLISAKNIGLKNGFIQLEEREFKSWMMRAFLAD